MSRFEWTVALRYLSAKRKQAVISVITVISILGVAAGVMAMIFARAINDVFKSALNSTSPRPPPHITTQKKNPSYEMEPWQQLLPNLRAVPHVPSAKYEEHTSDPFSPS